MPFGLAGRLGYRLRDGWLQWPTGKITERGRPLDGDVEQEAYRFQLHDAPIDSGTAAGYMLFTFLTTQDIADIPSSLLTVTASEASLTWTVGDGGAFTVGQFVWCEQECARVTAITVNDLTVVRGALGTRAARHSIATDEGIQPEVFGMLPWAVRRKAVLWAVDNGATATPIWVGTAGASPDLNSDGITFELPADPLWNTVKETMVGNTRGVVELSGCSGHAYPMLGGQFTIGTATTGATCARRRWDSYEQAAQSFIDASVVVLDGLSTVVDGSSHGTFRRDGVHGVLSFDFDATGTIDAPGNLLTVGFPPWQIQAVHVDRGSNRHALTFNMESCPSVAYAIWTDGSEQTFGMRSSYSWDGFYTYGTTSPSGRTLAFRKALKGIYSDDWAILFTDIVTSGSSRQFTAKCGWVPRRAGVPELSPLSHPWLTDPGPLQVVTVVNCEHWADGLRYAIIAQLDCTVDADWDWTEFDRLVWTTRGPQAVRNWILDGTRSVGDLLREANLLAGCSVGSRGGKLCLVPWQLPRADATSAVTLTTRDIQGDVIPFEKWKEGFANKVTLSSDILTVNILNEGSYRRYGEGRDIQINMAGVEVDRLRSLQPGEVYRQLLSRLSLWSDPLDVALFQVPINRHDEVYMGDTVTVDGWNLPAGNGRRGLVAGKGLVLGRTLDFDQGTMTLEVLLFKRLSHGYAPCCKILGPTLADNTVQIDLTPVRGAEDYAGSVASGDNDGGVSKFLPGDKVRLIRKDTTSAASESRTIDTITETSPGVWEVAFTTNLSGTFQGYIDGLLWVEMVLDVYNTATVAGKQYAWIASEATGLIGGTTDPAHRIAP
jgi:hypothetical protein